MKRLHLAIVLLLFVFPLFAGAALAAERTVPAQSRSTVTVDGAGMLPGDVADLRRALQEASVVRYTAYVPEVRKGDPAHALAQFIRSVNGRMNPASAFTPEQVVKGYYWGYSGVFSPTDERTSQNTLASRSYRTSPHVTPGYVKQMDELVDSFDKSGGGYDPIMCMLEIPDKVKVGKAEVRGGAATVPVQTLLGQNPARTIKVDLTQIDGKWLIDEVTCPR